MAYQSPEANYELIRDLFDNQYCYQLPTYCWTKPKVSKQSPVTFNADVYSTEQEYVIEVELPGFNKESINISIEQDTLTIDAKVLSKEKQVDGMKYIVKERKKRDFIRTFQLPKNVDKESQVGAQFQDGILRVTLAKRSEDAGKRTIKIE